MPWSFVEAAKPLAWPALPHPTAILHGSNDVVVPLAHSQKALESNPERRSRWSTTTTACKRVMPI